MVNQSIAPVSSKILVVDDHPIVRSGIVNRLALRPQWTVCGEASDAKEALKKVAEQLPDVVILDISLKNHSGLDLIGQIKSSSPESRVLIVSMYEDLSHIETALRNRADGYVSKREIAGQLLDAVEAVLAGRFFLWAGDTIRHNGELPQIVPSERINELTPREQQTLRLIGMGREAREIAEEMGISTKTVDTHRASIREKLGIHDSQALVLAGMVWSRSHSA